MIGALVAWVDGVGVSCLETLSDVVVVVAGAKVIVEVLGFGA